MGLVALVEPYVVSHRVVLEMKDPKGYRAQQWVTVHCEVEQVLYKFSWIVFSQMHVILCYKAFGLHLSCILDGCIFPFFRLFQFDNLTLWRERMCTAQCSYDYQVVKFHIWCQTWKTFVLAIPGSPEEEICHKLQLCSAGKKHFLHSRLCIFPHQ